MVSTFYFLLISERFGFIENLKLLQKKSTRTSGKSKTEYNERHKRAEIPQRKIQYTIDGTRKNAVNELGRSKTGRRYTVEQKSLCLALYKQGPRSYRFKEKWCILPTRRTLGRYSADLIFKSGVDSKMFEVIKNVVKDWPEEDKVCGVTFDEVSLKEQLSYSQAQDKIEGFIELSETNGTQKQKPRFATHALTFMVRGLMTNYKQPVGYFYTNGIKTFELVELVQLMIERIVSTGNAN